MVVAIYVVYRIGIHHISNKKMLLKSLAPVFFYIIMITGFFFWLVL